jgi:hypothetical protein
MKRFTMVLASALVLFAFASTILHAQVTLTSRATGNWNANDTWLSGTLTGTITTTTSSATVTGSGTSFTTELAVGADLYQTNGTTKIGTVASITSNTLLTLTANAANANTNAAFRTRKVPGASDAVLIRGADNIAVTIPTGVSATCASLTIGDQANHKNNGLIINGTGSLAVSGNLDFHRPNAGATNDLNIGSGTVTVGGNFTFVGTATNNNRFAKITITTGTLTITGDLILNAPAAATSQSNDIDMSGGAGTLNLGGAFSIAASGGGRLLAGTTSTFNYNGTSAQTVVIGTTNFNYNNLHINNTSASGATLSAAVTASNVTGNISVGNVNSGSLLKTNNLAVTLANSKTITVASGSTLDAGTSSIQMGTSATVTVNGTFKTANLDGFSGTTSTAIKSTNSPTITLGGSSTIEYNAASGTQTVTARSDYANLTLSGGGTKTMPGTAMTIAGNFTMSGTATATAGNALTVNGNFTIGSGATFTAGSFTHNLKGNWSNSGTFDAGTSTFVMNGTSAQTMSGSTFNNLTINNAAGVTLLTAETVNGTLTLTNGTLTLNGNNLTIGPSGTISGGSSSSYVKTDQDNAGMLVRQGVSTTMVTFPVGRSAYNPVTLKQTTDATARTYSVLVRDGVTPSSNDDASAVQRAWVIIQSPVSSSTVVEYTVQWNSGEEGATFAAATVGGRTTGLCAPWWHNPGGWTLLSTTQYGDITSITGSGFPAVATVQTKLPFGGSPWTIALRTGALPVQLASFTGTLIENNRVRLNWMTISEINNYGFYVQRRSVGVQEWTEIANSFVPGHGTTNEPQYYSFTDPTPITAATQYRLRQVDLDGTSHYSDPIQVDLPTSVPEVAPREFALKQNYPNPFNPSTEIKFSVENTGHAKLDVYNALGQKVATLFDGVAEAGQYYTVRFTATGLSSGVYFYRLESGKRSDVKKLVLMK